jgi:peroxiredoxin
MSLASAVYFTIGFGQKAHDCPEIGEQAPDLSFLSISGSAIKLSDFRGKTILVTLWTLRCPYDKQEMPYIQRIYEQNRADGFEVVAVNVADSPKEIRDYANENGYTFTFLMDPKGEIFGEYCIQRATPTNILIDSNGILRSIKFGAFHSTDEIVCFIDSRSCEKGAPDKIPPEISEATVSRVDANSAIVGWSTDESSTGTVVCSQENDADEIETDVADIATTHSLKMTDLKPDTLYYISITAKDLVGNTAQLDRVLSFRTLKPPITGTKPGNKAPEFTLETINGTRLSLNSFKNCKLMVVFLKALNEQCIYQMRLIQKADESLQNQGWQVIVISSVEDKEKVRKVISSNAFTFVVFLDTSGEVTNVYRPSLIPTTYFINEQGYIQDKKAGNFGSSEEILSLASINITVTEDIEPPQISELRIDSLSETTAKISWNTDEASTTQAQYWVNTNALSFSEPVIERTMQHEVLVTALVQGTTYNFVVVSKDAAGNETKSEPRTFTTTTAVFVDVSRVWIGNTYVAGADHHAIELVNNQKARNPSWQELLDFLRSDNTDEIEYDKSAFVCGDFAERLHNNAEKAGWRAAYVCLMLGPSLEYPSGSLHALNAFEVADLGIVFVDDTGKCSIDSCPGNLDKTVDVQVGMHYIPRSMFDRSIRWGDMGEVLKIETIQW